jgi:hypothetical protein
MKPKNFRTLVMTSWMGTFFGVIGCLIGLRSIGMPNWIVVVGIGVAGTFSVIVGSKQISELYDDSSEARNP